MTSPRITIGIPTYNGAWRLGNLLNSLSMRTPELLTGEARVVVVDDGSPTIEQTRYVVEEWRAKMPLDYVEHGHNRGISAGWNTTSRSHDCEYVVLANDDVIVPSGGWLRSLIYPLVNSPGVGVVGQNWHAFLADDVVQLLQSPTSDRDVVPRDPGSKQADPTRRDIGPCNPARVMCPTGQLFAFRREDFDAIGGFDETFKSFYEESSFGTSMAAERKKIGLQLNWTQCWHMWSETFRTSPELVADQRMAHSQAHYRRKWNVPDSFPLGREFDYTNPTHLGSVDDVEVRFLRGPDNTPAAGILRRDGAFVAI
jgi:glycosyltransferase involved in cell wall biosynthesis